jgi:hypothetical protein
VTWFRAYWLDADSRIVFGEHIEADELTQAVRSVQSRCVQHIGAQPERIEVWSGADRLFPPRPETPAKFDRREPTGT